MTTIRIILVLAFVSTHALHAQWEQANINGPLGAKVLTFAEADTMFYAGTSNSRQEYGGLFSGNDDGSNWERRITEIHPYVDVRCIVSRGHGTQTLETFAVTEVGFYRSLDLGYHWEVMNPTFGMEMRSLIAGDGFLLTSTATNGVYRSSDAGVTWVKSSDGIRSAHVDRPGAMRTTVLHQSPYPANEGSIYVGLFGVWPGDDTGGVYRSTDLGNSWIAQKSGLPTYVQVYSLSSCLDSLGGTLILAGTTEGVYYSKDFGATWRESRNGIGSFNINMFAVYGQHTFAATERGVYHSVDVEEGWMNINEGLTFHDIWSIYIRNCYIYAGTSSQGIWRRSLSDFNIVSVEPPPTPAAFALYQNYPNPVSSSYGSKITQIDYELADSGPVILSVCNVLGTSRVLVEEGVMSSGKHTTHFDTSGLPPGVYLYRLVAGNRSLVRKMLIIP